MLFISRVIASLWSGTVPGAMVGHRLNLATLPQWGSGRCGVSSDSVGPNKEPPKTNVIFPPAH